MILYENQYETLKRFGNTTISNQAVEEYGVEEIKKHIFDKTGLKVRVDKILEANEYITGAFYKTKSGYHYNIIVDSEQKKMEGG